MQTQIQVIIADDSTLQRVYLASFIEQLGYKVLMAEDGAEALEMVKTGTAEILISDYDMPHMNGVELTRNVRALELDNYVHVILVTGSGAEDVRGEALEAGADDFLNKGRDPTALKARVRAASRLIQHSRELARQHRKVREANERINRDLKDAANAQRQLLPDMHKDLKNTRVASAFVPSAVVSGDMFGCFFISQTQLGFYTVDVSGHGIHASLLSVAIGHLITPEFFAHNVLNGDACPDPAALISELNRRFSVWDNDDYFTMFCGILNVETGELVYSQAAYPSPFYLDPEGSIGSVGDGGFPVGMFYSATYENRSMRFDSGGTLVICSDAVTEAENPKMGAFGSARLREIVLASHGISTDAIPENITAALLDWRDGEPLEDDLTVVALRRS